MAASLFLNRVPRHPSARQPRGLIKINDVLVPMSTVQPNGFSTPGWITWEVDNNNFYAADTFRLALTATPLNQDFNGAWWAAQTSDIFIEIFAGFPSNPDVPVLSDLDSLIYARVDDIELDMTGRQITLNGRDMTAAMIDAKTTLKWEQLTASAIARQIAESHGLTKTYITDTTTVVGDYYKALHVQLPDLRSEWDLLTALAASANFNVYVKGKDLHFEPKPDASNKDVYEIYWDPATPERPYPLSNVKTLVFSRSMTVGRGIQVNVRSWNQKQKKGFTAQYPTKARGIQAGKSSPFGGTQIYSYVLANATQEAANQFAQQKYAELIQHEMKLVATMPADNKLHVTDVIQVTGTGTAYDQQYFPDSIVRSMSMSEGYAMTVRAKNHAADSVPQL